MKILAAVSFVTLASKFFDTFGKFPPAQFSKDVKTRKKFLEQGGNESISIKQLQHVLKQKKISENRE